MATFKRLDQVTNLKLQASDVKHGDILTIPANALIETVIVERNLEGPTGTFNIPDIFEVAITDFSTERVKLVREAITFGYSSIVRSLPVEIVDADVNAVYNVTVLMTLVN